ncbi:MAG: OmpH family outer membrane protein [Polyangiales bacterium]
MRSKSFVARLALAFALVAPCAVMPARTLGAAEMKIVYCDMEVTIATVDEGREARKALDKEQGKREADIQAREADIKRMQDELERQAKTFSKSAIERQAALIQQAFGDYQQQLAKYNKELQQKEREYFDPIDRKLHLVLEEVAQQDGYAMILSRRSVPYGRKDLDVTDKIIQEYNRRHPVAFKADDKKGDKKGDKKPVKPISKEPPPAPKMK